MSRFSGPSEFRENPLAHFEKEPQLSVSYDEWVSAFDKSPCRKADRCLRTSEAVGVPVHEARVPLVRRQHHAIEPPLSIVTLCKAHCT